MDTSKRQLLLAEENAASRPQKCVFDKAQRVDAVDLETRTRICVEVGKLSAYRHILRLDGKSFRILNILEWVA